MILIEKKSLEIGSEQHFLLMEAKNARRALKNKNELYLFIAIKVISLTRQEYLQ